MRWSYSRDELERIRGDERALSEEIGKSVGFVLFRMKQEGLVPDLGLLMDCASPCSLAFILDNFDLTMGQKKRLGPFFKNSARAKRVDGPMDKEAIDDALKNKGELRSDAVLDLGQLREHWKALVDLMDSEDGRSVETVVENSLKGLSPDEALSLDKGFLSRVLDSLERVPGIFSTERGRLEYKELSLEYRRANGQRPRLSDFSNWPFGPEDKKLLVSLLEPRRDGGHCEPYSSLAKIPGAAALITKVEYLKGFGPDVDHFTSAEVLENISLIRGVWKGLAEGDGKRNHRWVGDLLQAKSSVEAFKEVVDQGFVKDLLDKGMSTDFGGVWQDDQDSLEKLAHLRRVILTHASKSKNTVMGGSAAGHLMDDFMSSQRVNPESGDGAIVARYCTGLIKRHLDSSSQDFYETVSYSTGSWFSEAIWMPVALACEENPSANALLFLLSGLEIVAKRGGWQNSVQKKGLEESVERVCSRLDERTVAIVCKPFGFESKSKGTGVRAKASFEDCFLMADYKSFSSLPEGTAKLLSRFDPDFGKRVLELGIPLPENVLLGMLHGDAEKNKGFLRDYVRMFGNEIQGLTGFQKALTTHPMGTWISGRESESRDSGLLKRAVLLAPELFGANEDLLELEKQRKAADREASRRDGDGWYGPSNEGEPESSEEKGDESLAKRSESLSALKTRLGNEMRDLLEGMSFEALNEGLKEALKNKDWTVFNALEKKAPSAQGAGLMFAEALNAMGSREVLDHLSQAAFRRQVASSMPYDMKDLKVSLSYPSAKENTEVARALTGCFDGEDDRIKSLGFFDKKARSGFAAEFALEMFPSAVPYSYRLSPVCKTADKSQYSSSLVAGLYSGRQLISLWDGLEKEGGWLCNQDVNARTADFFAENFENDKEGFLGFLEMAKDRPVLYAMLCNSSVIERVNDSWRKDRDFEGGRPRDEMSSRFALENFDWGVLMKGVGEVCDMMRERDGDPGFNQKLASRILSSVVWTTYWDTTDRSTGATGYHSLLPADKTRGLIGVLFEKAPLFLMGTKVIGCEDNVPGHIQEMFGAYAREGSAISFLLPAHAHKLEYFAIENRFETYCDDILKGAMSWLLDDKNKVELEFFDWLVDQHSFVSSDVVWDRQGEFFKGAQIDPYQDVLSHLEESKPLREMLTSVMEVAELRGSMPSDNERRRVAISV